MSTERKTLENVVAQLPYYLQKFIMSAARGGGANEAPLYRLTTQISYKDYR